MKHYVLSTCDNVLQAFILSSAHHYWVKGLLLTLLYGQGNGGWKWLNDLLKGTEIAHNMVKSRNCNLGPVRHRSVWRFYEDSVKEVLKPFYGDFPGGPVVKTLPSNAGGVG